MDNLQLGLKKLRQYADAFPRRVEEMCDCYNAGNSFKPLP